MQDVVISAAQLRAAMGMLGWTAERLSQASGVSPTSTGSCWLSTVPALYSKTAAFGGAEGPPYNTGFQPRALKPLSSFSVLSMNFVNVSRYGTRRRPYHRIVSMRGRQGRKLTMGRTNRQPNRDIRSTPGRNALADSLRAASRPRGVVGEVGEPEPTSPPKS
jgi:hypothetical protein